MSSDYSTSTVDHVDEQTGIPVDEYGNFLKNTSDWDGSIIPGWDKKGTELRMLLDPYGILEWAIGSGDDFYCFDYEIEGHWLILDSTINSETGSFIMGAEKYVIDLDDPNDYDFQALEMVGQALTWIADNEVRHNKKGWNQDYYYFHRCVHLAVMRYRGESVPDFSDRQKRFGGKRINRYCGLVS